MSFKSVGKRLRIVAWKTEKGGGVRADQLIGGT